jgi:hypothetical protein
LLWLKPAQTKLGHQPSSHATYKTPGRGTRSWVRGLTVLGSIIERVRVPPLEQARLGQRLLDDDLGWIQGCRLVMACGTGASGYPCWRGSPQLRGELEGGAPRGGEGLGVGLVLLLSLRLVGGGWLLRVRGLIGVGRSVLVGCSGRGWKSHGLEVVRAKADVGQKGSTLPREGN